MKAKDISSDDFSGVVSTVDDAKRYDRITTVGNSRQWKNLPAKMPVCYFLPVVFIISSISQFFFFN